MTHRGEEEMKLDLAYREQRSAIARTHAAADRMLASSSPPTSTSAIANASATSGNGMLKHMSWATRFAAWIGFVRYT